jgi:hypothetical protein
VAVAVAVAVAVDCVLRMQRVVFADTDGDSMADIGSEQAPAGDAELAGQLGAREIDSGFHGPFGVLCPARTPVPYSHSNKGSTMRGPG